MDAQVSELRLTRCCWRCYSPCRRSYTGLTPPASTSDENGDGEADEMVGHGTHVAEVVKLAAPKARIIPRAQVGRPGQRDFVLAEAIQFASRNGAGAMDLSLGSSRESDLLENVIKEDDDGGDTSGRNAIFVAAAGNEITSASRYPAAEDGALAVTLVDQERKKSAFANHGEWVDAT